MNNKKKLTAKEEAFCVAYTTIGSDTFSNGTKSAIEAGYAEDSSRTQACRMLRKEHIKKRIRELYDNNMEENMVTVSSVLANLAHNRLMARKHHQYSVAKSCTELEGKYKGMFKDREDNTGEGLSINVHLPEGYEDKEKTPEDRRLEIVEQNTG